MKKNMKFEDAMLLLEDIVKMLENGSLSLDESLEKFEEAVALVKFCNEKLESAEQKVRILTEAMDGTVSDAPFDVDENET